MEEFKLLDAQFNQTSLPDQGVWLVTRYSNIFFDKPHLDYLSTLNCDVCVVGTEMVVHPTIQAHWPQFYTVWDESTTLSKQTQQLWIDGKLIQEWTQPQSLRAFAHHSTARRSFCQQWGSHGMKKITEFTDATIWNRITLHSILPEDSMLSQVQWFALVPNLELEKSILDNGQIIC